MLTLTENASTVVKGIVEQSEGAKEAGLRISQDAADSPALHVMPTEAPEPGDHVLEDGGARVFLEETAASPWATRSSTRRLMTTAAWSSPSPSATTDPQTSR